MKRNLHIVVSCTDRKKLPVQDSLCMSSIGAVEIEGRLDEWLTRLGEVKQDDMRPAKDVYCGYHWSIAMRSLDLASQNSKIKTAKLWICSAGYGVIGSAHPIPGYAATFSKGSPDYIKSDPVLWWDLLTRSMGKPEGRLSSISALAASDPRSTIVVVASGIYIKAMIRDIEEAVRLLDKSSHLMVLSAGSFSQRESEEFEAIKSNLLPVTSKLRVLNPDEPRSRGVVNVTALEYLLEMNTNMNCEELAHRLIEAQSHIGSDSMPQRQSTSDNEVADFIKDQLDRGEYSTKTALLREYRRTGRACEQSRFGEIYRKVAESCQ